MDKYKEFELRKNITYVIFSIIEDKTLPYGKLAAAVNRKYCDGLNIYLYAKILLLNRFLLNVREHLHDGLTPQLEETLSNNEKAILAFIIKNLQENKVLLSSMHNVELFRGGEMPLADYLAEFY